MILVRVGAPIWLSTIVVSWGMCATLFAAMKTETEFYVLRFLLGVTECGTFPGAHPAACNPPALLLPLDACGYGC